MARPDQRIRGRCHGNGVYQVWIWSVTSCKCQVLVCSTCDWLLSLACDRLLSSACLNIRMELQILRAGPSLIDIIRMMSRWVSRRKARPSICQNRSRNRSDHCHCHVISSTPPDHLTSSLNCLACSSQPGRDSMKSDTLEGKSEKNPFVIHTVSKMCATQCTLIQIN